MKNKFLFAASGSLVAAALFMNLAVGTAFAQTPAPATQTGHGWGGRMGMKFGAHGSSTLPMNNIQGNGQPVVGGTVSAINGSILTLATAQGGVTYSVDASHATIDRGNATSSVSQIAVGDHVVVQGSVNGTAVTASSVIDQGAPKTSRASGIPTKGFGGFMGALGGFFHRLFGFF
ncbi:MAG: hypothetical protein KGH79_04930 [Patescibacteria group bacterium]|nr:hypothetical protein [Patescibacteria group bacterium]